jgi:hypothetical protein
VPSTWLPRHKNLISSIFTVLVTCSLQLFVLRDLLTQLTTALLDASDYPLVAWIIANQQSNWLSGHWLNLFATNAFYPSPSALLFADLFFPISLLTLPLTVFHNPLLTTNLALILTLLLNTIAAWWLSRRFQLSWWPQLAVTFFLSCSPFLFSQLSHMQMLPVWPTYLALGFMLVPKKRILTGVIIGVLALLQTTSGVYLGFMLLCLLAWWTVIEMVAQRKLIKQRSVALLITLPLVISLALNFPIFWMYRQVQQEYQVQRDPGQYVDYAAQINDYFLPTRNTLLSKLPIVVTISSWQRHTTGEPARWLPISLVILVVLGISQWKKNQKIVGLGSGLAWWGLIASLGTRLTWNAHYLAWPLPYLVILKIFPFLSFFRSTSRWSFLFFLGLTLLATLGLKKLITYRHGRWLIFGLIIWFLVEVIPMAATATEIKLSTSGCHATDIKLELPVFHYYDAARIRLDPGYSSVMMLSNWQSGCTIMNGYSGVIPPSLYQLDSELSQALTDNNRDLFIKLLKQQPATLLQLNTSYFSLPAQARLKDWLSNLDIKVIE